MFVTFEGVDWSGKSTQTGLLAGWLREQGRAVLETREPGGTPAAEAIREVVLHGPEMAAWTEAALYAAARADHVAHAIRPALERGEDVVCDRYLDSSVAYQGIARGLGEEQVRNLSLLVTGGLLPDRTFLVLLDPEEAAARAGGDHDRIEREGEDFMRRADEGFRALARAEPERIVPLDGSLPADEIAEEVREHVSLSRPRRPACSRAPCARGRRTRTSSTGRRASASARRRAPSRTRSSRRSGRSTPTSTRSRRSAR
jgi:dTMP kinase